MKRQTREEPKLDQLCFTSVELGQLVQGLVQSDKINVFSWSRQAVMQFDTVELSAALSALLVSSVLNKNPPHGLRSSGEKVATWTSPRRQCGTPSNP